MTENIKMNEQWRRLGAETERWEIVIWLRDHGEEYLKNTPDTPFAHDPIIKLALAIQAAKHNPTYKKRGA